MNILKCVALVSAIVPSVSAGSLTDGFESYGLSSFPSGPWLEVASRIDNPTTPIPSAQIIDTTNAQGQATQAVQLVDAVGTSQGLLAEIERASRHVLEVDVRVDSYATSNGATWTGAAGFFAETEREDLNFGPQVAIYASGNSQRWRVFLQNGDAGSPAFDFGIGSNRGIAADVNRWYRLRLEVETETGMTIASVLDGATRDVLGSRTFNPTSWDGARSDWDSVVLFDGEYNSSGIGNGGVATYDNVFYTPAPGAALVCSAPLLWGFRRRRARAAE